MNSKKGEKGRNEFENIDNKEDENTLSQKEHFINRLRYEMGR